VSRLTLATCQFPVTSDPARNAQWIARQMSAAKTRKAHIAHFPECALSGYAGPDLESYDGYDWSALRTACERVFALARELRLWVVVGSAHRLSGKHKPHNSLYVVDDRGELVERYDKRFCAGDRRGRTGDLAQYTPGNHRTVFEVRGVRCVEHAINQKPGMVIWSRGLGTVPAFNSWLCLMAPIERTVASSSGGNSGPDDCSGVISFPFTHAYLQSKALTAGTKVYAQGWFSDPNSSGGAGISTALVFAIAP